MIKSKLLALITLTCLCLPLLLVTVRANQKSESIETQRESFWQKLLKQRQELEELSKSQHLPLREVMSKKEFSDKFPMLPHGRALDSLPSLYQTELRIATIPKNLQRTNQPYSILAIVYKNNNNQIEVKIAPDTVTARRTLNLSGDWDFAQRVIDFPNIIKK